MSEPVQQNQVEASLQPIRDMITVLANVPKARQQFTTDLNKKIGQVDKAIENLAKILTDIKSMKGEVAEASRKIKQESTIGAAKMQQAVKAAKREAQLAQQRKKAASMSKKKPKGKPAAKKAFDPMALEGEEFDKHMEFLMTGGR